MKPSTQWLAVLAATLCLYGGAVAQDTRSSTGCPNGAASASGTSASPDGTKDSKSADTKAARHTQQVARQQGTLPATFPECANSTERNARAECVSAAWEAQQSANPC